VNVSLAPESVPQYTGRGSGPRAGFWRRFAALLIDGVLLGIVTGILFAVLKTTGELLGIVISASYFTYFEGGPRGQTPGKTVMGIRVISLADGKSIGYQRGFIRWLGRIVSAFVIYIGYFWMLWDRESQCWQDKFAGSVVVPVSAYPPPS
jgi:uncharacterized RDD family membrane protein YckC